MAMCESVQYHSGGTESEQGKATVTNTVEPARPSDCERAGLHWGHCSQGEGPPTELGSVRVEIMVTRQRLWGPL